ncbi:hypothetical protein Rhopal_000147-T1 [Rhodotorula paludigena]|uniref:Xylanolytic transcriptional activator regulatory domain-containing protein n=1 Tax=Rhodotorula paludigena TaxID=86838 RepID=A0AAV5GDP0_9BASI|nr:hypothetical protein Rhopal_000147-T1 [Rhodotorula paludigena]
MADESDSAFALPALASLAAASGPDSASPPPPPPPHLPQPQPSLRYRMLGQLGGHAAQAFPSMSAIASTSAVPYDAALPGEGAGTGRAGSHDAAGAEGDGTRAGKGQKRKSSVGSSSTAAGGLGGAADDDTQKAKKPKIPRACDEEDSDPMLCTYCQKHRLDCTWFLPISETRFKKQREKEEAEKASASAAAAAVALPTAATSATLARQAARAEAISPGPSPTTAAPGGGHNVPKQQIFPIDANRGAASSPDSQTHSGPRKEPRIVGYTSISHLMHSTSTFPTERMIPVDFKYSQQLSVDERGDGFIRVISAGDGDPSQGGEPVAIQGIEHSDAEKLLNYFFTTHANHFPIVAKADFLGSSRQAGDNEPSGPAPLLFNAICAVSALSHHVAPSILRTIKATIRSHLRDEDMLDNSTIPNIQALLIYAFSMELEKGTAASKTWNILGLAIRMAQDLGLHRKLGSERKEQSEGDHTELRRRVWGGCLIADRWIAAIYGQPMMIDLADCDTMLPSVFDIRPNLEFDAQRRPYLFNSALISLSILLGRILKAVYSPTGIMLLSEKDAMSLRNDLEAWVSGLPEELRFQGPDKSTPEQGFLHLLYIPVRFLITRPFMRISFQLPERFAALSVGTQQWSTVEHEARLAIEWVDKNESCLEGWFVGTYAFFICSLIQYHSHIRRRDSTSLSTLRLARDCLKRLVVPDGECYVRAKIAEIIHLLYHTACSVARWAPEAAEGMSPASGGTTAVTTLNPTVGVRQREQDWHLRYKKDGGFFLTDRRVNDPTGLIRSSGSPASPGSNASPGTLGSPYTSSLRTTHTAVEGEGAFASSASADKTSAGEAGASGAAASGTTATRLSGSPPVQVPTGLPISTLPPVTTTAIDPSLSAGLPPATTAPAPNPPPDLSFAFPDSTFDNLSFNPTLNFGTFDGTATPLSSTSLSGGGGGGSGLGGLGLGGVGNGTGGTSFLGGPLGSGTDAFDPFGFAGDGTPAMLPDSLFDWAQWQNFADSFGLPPDGKTPSAAGSTGTPKV